MKMLLIIRSEAGFPSTNPYKRKLNRKKYRKVHVKGFIPANVTDKYT